MDKFSVVEPETGKTVELNNFIDFFDFIVLGFLCDCKKCVAKRSTITKEDNNIQCFSE